MQPKTLSFAPIMLVLKTKSTKHAESLLKNAKFFPSCATYFRGSGLKAANSTVLRSAQDKIFSRHFFLGDTMWLRKTIAPISSLFLLGLLAGCGGSSSTKAVAPPTGGFGNSNLNGTYVFSVSGTDSQGDSLALVGTLIANGSGGITGGTIDMNDSGFAISSPVIAPISNSPISNSSSYSVGVDGRGTAKLNTSTPFSTIVLDFVLSSNSHGLITEFDNNASGSGTLDLQTASLSQSSLTGPYAFSFSGIDTNGNPFVTVGAFTLGATGAISGGAEDFNDADLPYTNESLGGQVTLGPASSAATTLSTSSFGNLTFDVYAIDSTHLKFIEMDSVPILVGDAYSETTSTVPTGTLAFTTDGFFPFSGTSSVPFAAGGFMTTDGAGNITGSEDENNGGVPSTSALSFTANYTNTGSAIPSRFVLNNFAGFLGGSEYVAYPSSGGLLLLEIDSSGLLAGAAYTQTSPVPSYAASQGYGLNLTGVNLSDDVEVDDIAEFTAASGGTLTGIVDENYDPGGDPNPDLALTGTFGSIDATGRYGIAATAGTSSTSTLNGGFDLTFYSVDGTTFPFIESDSGQVATGVLVLQSGSGASSAARSHMFIARPLVRPKGFKREAK